jgi:myo-inositol-1(or 4)-monophosphatase
LQANSQALAGDISASQLLDVCVTAAERAASVIDDALDGVTTLEWRTKGESDFVTEVDTRAEKAIVDTIGDRVPEAVIVGEELSPETAISGSGVTFIVDPLDGTTNFLHGYPEYSVSIAAASKGQLIAAVVRNLTRDETFTATAGGGAFLNGARISVSKETEPYRALIGTGFPFKRHDLLEKYAQQFIKVSQHTAGIRRAGSAALDLSNLACGRFDGFWELVLGPWDIAAGVLIVREAGGLVTDFEGNEKQISHGAVVAGNPEIHPWLLRLVRKAVNDELDLDK